MNSTEEQKVAVPNISKGGAFKKKYGISRSMAQAVKKAGYELIPSGIAQYRQKRKAAKKAIRKIQQERHTTKKALRSKSGGKK